MSRKPESLITHIELTQPRLTNRRLAEYMAASPIRKRTLIRNTKYRKADPEVSYAEGFAVIGDMLADGDLVTTRLSDAAEDFHDRMDVDGYFDRLRIDLTGDMFDWLADHRTPLKLPDADRFDDSRTWGRGGSWSVEGVTLDPEIYLRLSRLRRGFKTVGAATLRYSKSGALKPAKSDIGVADWQSALIHGYLTDTITDDTLRPDPALCLTLDLRAGHAHPAPGNSVTLMQHIAATCASISERWPNIPPPDNAIIGTAADIPAPRPEPSIPF